MSHVILLCLCALALLGALPFVFFRSGRFTAGWLLTALPFFLTAGVLLGALAGLLRPAPLPLAIAATLSYCAVLLAAGSIALISLTIGVHRAPVSMWHQRDDQPHVLVTSGPYALVRHPFYAAFILMLTASVAAFPHALTAALALLGAVQLNRTARREEARLLASRLSADYADYMQRTRRFIPLPRRRMPRLDEEVSRRRGRARSRPAHRASIRRAS